METFEASIFLFWVQIHVNVTLITVTPVCHKL